MTTSVETAHDSVSVPDEDLPRLVALMAEYKDVDGVVEAARRVRDAGYTVWDVHSPFPIHGIDKAMGIRPTILPWIVLGAGITGMITGIVLTVWTMKYGYPYLISGKPLNSFPAWIPVIFELTILFSALAAVFGMLMLNKLPMLYNPLLNHARFRRVTDDRFFLVIDVQDERFNEMETLRLLEATEPVVVERIED